MFKRSDKAVNSSICEGILEDYSWNRLCSRNEIRFCNAERHSGKDRERNKAMLFNKQICALTNIEHPYISPFKSDDRR